MSQSRTVSRNNSVVPDDYPVSPPSRLTNGTEQAPSKLEKKQIRTNALLCLAYFLYGSGTGIYAPLYPRQATITGLAPYIYGSVIGISYLVAMLFYPLACRMVVFITCKQSVCMSMFVIGVCRILFGTLTLMSDKAYFVGLSFAIQVVEGFGTGALLSSTVITVFSPRSAKVKSNMLGMAAFLTLGYTLGPIAGEAVNKASGVSVPFYGIGALTVLAAICTAALLPEPGEKITYKEIPVVSWVKEEPKLLIYLYIIFATLNYTGFIAVVLEALLRQFHLDKVFTGMVFSIAPFACGLSAYGWMWMTKKGFNSLLMICFASLLILASLVLIGPAPFTTLELSLTYVTTALLLKGLGTGGKLACVAYAANRDLRSKRNSNDIFDQLIIPTIFIFGSLFGYFTGSVIAGFTYFYIDVEKATYVLFGLEIITIVASFVFAFKRNYRSPRRINFDEERQPILGT